MNGAAVSVRRIDCSSGFVVSNRLGIMCPFVVVGALCLTVVCVDIGNVGEVDDGSMYEK